MFNASRLRRSAILGALACALLAATTGAVAARNPTTTRTVAYSSEQASRLSRAPPPDPRQKSTLTRSDDSPRLTAAQAQERYYSSYGEPEPITAPVAPAPTDDTPWLTICPRRRRARRRIDRRHPSPSAAAPPPRRPRHDLTHPGARLNQAGAPTTAHPARGHPHGNGSPASLRRSTTRSDSR